MKNVIISIFIICCIAGCTKDDDELILYNKVRFKLDGVQYELNDYKNVSATEFSEDLSIPFYSFISSVGEVYNPNIATISIVSNSEIKQKKYIYNSYSLPEYPTFQLISSDGISYMFEAHLSSATYNTYINFVTLNKSIGSKVSGNFQFDHVAKLDKNGNLISAEHTITDGYFEVTVKQ